MEKTEVHWNSVGGNVYRREDEEKTGGHGGANR